MTIRELNHVALAVTDVERSAAFYRDVLGLPPLARPGFDFPGAWFRIGGGGQQLHLIGGRDVRHHSGRSMDGHFALEVADIAAAELQLRRQQASFRGPGLRPDGAVQIFVSDPDGNVIELCGALPATTAPLG